MPAKISKKQQEILDYIYQPWRETDLFAEIPLNPGRLRFATTVFRWSAQRWRPCQW